MQRYALFGLPVTAFDSVDEVVNTMEALADTPDSAVVATNINPHSFHLAKQHPEYCGMLWNSDFVYPDGIGITLALSLVHGVRATRVSFDATSLYHPFFRMLDRRRKALFVAGASPGVAEQAVARMAGQYSNIRYVGTIHGYHDVERIAMAVMEAGANVVLVGMGMPKQEQVLFALRARGFTGIALTCGGFLDQFVASQSYYPAWVDRLELRFAYRLIKEPRRLWRRYLIEYMPFLGYVATSTVLERTKLRTGWIPERLRRLQAEATQGPGSDEEAAGPARRYVGSTERTRSFSI